MVQREGERVKKRCGQAFFVFIFGIFLVFYPRIGQAQNDYPGFGFLMSWTQYTAISLEKNDFDISQQTAQIIFRDPQTFWLSFGLGREEIDTDYPFSQGKEIDDDLCFQVAGAYYVAPNLELGIPADISLGAEYSRARHDVGDDKLTHQLIIVTVNMEWDYPPAKPYIRVGGIRSSLDHPEVDEENTSAFFVGGVRFSLGQYLAVGAEFNISEDIGFGTTLGYSF